MNSTLTIALVALVVAFVVLLLIGRTIRRGRPIEGDSAVDSEALIAPYPAADAPAPDLGAPIVGATTGGLAAETVTLVDGPAAAGEATRLVVEPLKHHHAPAPEPTPAPTSAPVTAPQPAPDPESVAIPEPAAPEPATAETPTAVPTGSDDLTRLKGVGPKLAVLLSTLGVTRFDQIAAWTPGDLARIDASLGAFAGRATRDQWVEQAQLLATGRTADYEAKFGKLS